ncbi:MAG: FAD-dependent oxidoreductase [Epsilonproteobacteria bacterium]|nr:FAD-dependent oxidoreductase [Campylobacterota bacterium]
MKRRDFFKFLGISAIATSIPAAAKTIKPKVVIIGGGYGGRTVAKYLKIWAGDSVDVTLIDKDKYFTSPILSNLVLNGQKNINELRFDYSKTRSKYKINFINKTASFIDKKNKRVFFDNKNFINYDKLVLATGIDFIKTNNYDFNKVPHAWIAGEQTLLLKRKIDNLHNGDTFVLTIPKAPYRCPPGPYERACVVADYLKNKKHLHVNVVVLDENDDILVEKESFQKAFDRYGIEYKSNAKVTHVDDSHLIVTYEQQGVSKHLKAALLNVIPNQKAAPIVINSHLTDSSNFAPVDLRSYESTIAKDIYIVGDSHKSTQPKAGHIANVEAKICADAILRSLNGYELYPKPKTNSACYSPLSSSTATWLTAVYEYDEGSKSMKKVSGGAGKESSKNYKEMFNWTGNLFFDTFG